VKSLRSIPHRRIYLACKRIVLNDWQPTCSIEILRLRARVLADIRLFFSERAVLEVETPLLSYSSGTDPQLDFFTTDYCLPPVRHTLFLQTSPEFAMKRLLAAGSGSIYQLCKAFRNGESDAIIILNLPCWNGIGSVSHCLN